MAGLLQLPCQFCKKIAQGLVLASFAFRLSYHHKRTEGKGNTVYSLFRNIDSWESWSSDAPFLFSVSRFCCLVRRLLRKMAMEKPDSIFPCCSSSIALSRFLPPYYWHSISRSARRLLLLFLSALLNSSVVVYQSFGCCARKVSIRFNSARMSAIVFVFIVNLKEMMDDLGCPVPGRPPNVLPLEMGHRNFSMCVRTTIQK